jgi:hypothetical protein
VSYTYLIKSLPRSICISKTYFNILQIVYCEQVSAGLRKFSFTNWKNTSNTCTPISGQTEKSTRRRKKNTSAMQETKRNTGKNRVYDWRVVVSDKAASIVCTATCTRYPCNEFWIVVIPPFSRHGKRRLLKAFSLVEALPSSRGSFV